MKRYAIFMYIEGAEDRTDNVVAYVEANDPFEACEKAGYNDPSTHFARQVNSMEQETKYVADAEELVKKLRGQIDELNAADKKEYEATKNICPNCGGTLNKARNCKACGFGIDEVAINGHIVNKNELDKAIRAAKRQAKKNQTPATP